MNIDLRTLGDTENIALIVVAIGVVIALAIAFGVVYATARRKRSFRRKLLP